MISPVTAADPPSRWWWRQCVHAGSSMPHCFTLLIVLLVDVRVFVCEEGGMCADNTLVWGASKTGSACSSAASLLAGLGCA